MPGPSDAAPTVAAVDTEAGRRLFEELRRIIIEVVGEDELFGIEIGPETSIQEEIQLESIEVVAVAEIMRERHGEVDFVGWLSGLELDQIIALTMGDIVEFLVAAGA